MIGAVLGVLAGLVCFFLLKSAVKTFSKNGINAKAVIFLLLQFLIPLFMLLLIALILTQQLIHAAISLCLTFVIAAVIYFLLKMSKKGKKNG